MFVEPDQGSVNYRYERKFVASFVPIHNIHSLIKLHPAFFSEAWPQRRINNIYMDTFDFNCYKDNTSGISERHKIRIRWYGELYGRIHSPKLEIKVKKNALGYKKVYDLPEFTHKEGMNYSEFYQRVLSGSDLSHAFISQLLSYEPKLINSYSRTYWESFDHNYRITVDENLKFCKVASSHQQKNFFHRDEVNRIIELKYDEEFDDSAGEISVKLPFRLSKMSKYVTGINLVWNQFNDMPE